MERLTVKPRELAAALGICLQTVHRRIKDGSIRTVALGPSKLIPATELARLLGERHETVAEVQEERA